MRMLLHRKKLTAVIVFAVVIGIAASLYSPLSERSTSGTSIQESISDTGLSYGAQAYSQLAPRMPTGAGGRGAAGGGQPSAGGSQIPTPNMNMSLPSGNMKPPRGDGRPQEGTLPEDRLPDVPSYDFSETLYPYRVMLTEAEREVYDQVYANAEALYDSLPLHRQLSTNSLQRVMTAVFCDHPELFWLDTSYEYSYTAQGYAVSVTLTFNSTAKNIDTYKERFDATTQKALQGAQSLSTDLEKEIYIHDYLIDNVSYDLDSALNQSAYSALVNGESVCAGYARAFQYLMQQLDVTCYFCTGYSGGGSHAWNIVYLDGGYYNVDVTWDDTAQTESGKRCYDYFNATDSEFKTSHTRSDLSVYLPACTATEYRYAA